MPVKMCQKKNFYRNTFAFEKVEYNIKICSWEIGTKMSKKKVFDFSFFGIWYPFSNTTVSHMIVCVSFSVKFMYAV